MIVITVLIAIVVTLFVGIQDPIIQKFAVRFAGGYLSEKTGADIKIGGLAVTPDFQVYLDDVDVKDLRGNDLAKIEKLRAKIYVGELLEGHIHLGRVALRNADVNMIQYEGEEGFNYQFLADFFSSDKEKEKSPDPLSLQIDNINVSNLNFVMWNQNKDRPEKSELNAIDYAHLDLDSLFLAVKDFRIIGDSIHTVVEMLKAKEMSGFEIKMFQSDVIVAQSGIRLTDMQMETNNSLIHTDLNMLYNSYRAFKDFVDSVTFDATIYPTDILLSDIGAFSPVMYKMPDRILFQGRFTGPIEHFSVDDIDAKIGKSTSLQGSISMHPLDFDDGEHRMNIKKFRFTYDDIVNFYIPGKTGTVPLPESLKTLNSGTASINFKGSYNNFNSEVHLLSDIGNVDVSVGRNKKANGDNIFSGSIAADRIDAGMIANASKFVGMLDLNADFTANFPKNGDIDLTVNGKAYRAELLGNHIDEVILNGDLKENQFVGKVTVDDDDLGLDFDGLIDFRNKKNPKADFAARISHADLSALKLMKNDSISEVSTYIEANLRGFNIDNLEGELHLDSTVYRDSRGSYFMKYFDATIVNDNVMDRRININNDFFNFDMAGKINFSKLMMSLNEYGDYYVHFPIFEKNLEEFQKYKLKNDVEQDFVVSLDLKDTKTLSRLFMPSVKIAKNTTIDGAFTSKSRQLRLTARSKSIKVGDLSICDVELKNFNTPSAIYGSLSVGEVVWTNMSKTDTVSYGLDNIMMTAKMANDTISSRIIWDDEFQEDHNKALIESDFHPHDGGGIITINNANIRINDSVWMVSPSNYIDFTDKKVTLSNLMFSHNNQSIRVDGFVPKTASDTLGVQLRSFDISNLDILYERKGFDIDGFITGDVLVSSIKDNPMVLANVTIDKLAVNDDVVGDAVINSSWDNPNKAVNMNVNIIEHDHKTLNVNGSYYTARKADNLDFDIGLDSLRMSILGPVLAGIVTRMQGFASGEITVAGSLKQPVLDGQLRIIDGGCKVDYLKTFYTFAPTIHIDSHEIGLNDLVLVDTLGNKAIVEGKITHNYLKDFNLDLTLHPRQFLAMATTAKDNDSFYGTAIADGLVNVRGPFNNIFLGIKARTQKGTAVTIPISHSTTVKDNDFIEFVQKPVVVEEEDELQPEEEKKEKSKKNLTLNLDLDVTDEAALHIDLPDIGNLDATGNGNIKLGTTSTTKLSLIGDYIIENGRFQLNYKNLITRNFDLKKGGTIVFTGEPTDGRINATGAYTVKAGLASLGVEVDSTSSSSTSVNVECLIHLKDALLNPTITFGMKLPNASEDISQTVFALIDTTNQAVMTSQALSLLVLGTFSYAGNSANNNSTNYLDALTNNLVFRGMNLDLTDNVNLGLSYHSGGAAYDEYQIALRTELFNNRLTLETNLGMISNNNPETGNASNLIGEFDIYYKLTKDGRLQAHFYNHSNYNSNYSSFSFDRLAPYTQGLGVTYSRSFNRISDLFQRKKTITSGPVINKPKGKENP